MRESRLQHSAETGSGTTPLPALPNSDAAAREGTLSRDEMERRRMKAAGHLLKGSSAGFVAAKFGVSRTTAFRWQRVITEKGVDSLKRRTATGRPPSLSAEQLARLAQICSESPWAQGLPDGRWTAVLLAKLIEERFGVHYSQDHVGRLVSKLGRKAQYQILGVEYSCVSPKP
jgi:transposase